jgi:hypothetical protein
MSSSSALLASSLAPSSLATSAQGSGGQAAILADLARARGLIEGKFLDLGVTLERAVEVIGAMLGLLDELAAGLDAQTVDRTTDTLSGAARQLNALATAHDQRKTRFQRLANAGAGVRMRNLEMRRTLSYLRAFAINIKITASGIPGAYAEFENFSEEINAAIAQADGQLDAFNRDLDDLGRQFTRALGCEGELERRCATLLPALPNRLEADANAIAGHHKQVSALAAELAEVARRVQAKVGGALCALQVGDATRQRIEHVEEGLRLLAQSGPRAQAMAPTIHALLAAQLDEAANDFSDDLDRLAQSLDGVAADAGEILRLHDQVMGGAGSEDDNVLRRLELSIAEAMTLVGEIETVERASQEVGSAASATAADLVRGITDIRAIKTAIHHMALNAHLKCCRVGEAGKPLSVIAVALRVQAVELDTCAVQTEGDLSNLGREAETEDSEGLGSTAVGELLGVAVIPIRQAADKAGGDLSAMMDKGGQIAQSLRTATERLNFRRDVTEVLREQAFGLCADQAPRAPPSDAETLAGLRTLMNRIGALYTMARERQIHAAFAVDAEDGDEAAEIGVVETEDAFEDFAAA